MLTRRRSSCPASPSPGALSSTRPPQQACRCWSRGGWLCRNAGSRAGGDHRRPVRPARRRRDDREACLDGRAVRSRAACHGTSVRPRLSNQWGPDRFAHGILEALELARSTHDPRNTSPRRRRDEPDEPDTNHAHSTRDEPTHPKSLGLAPSLQRPGPGARRRHGAEHPGHDRGPEPAEQRRDDRDAHALAARP